MSFAVQNVAKKLVSVSHTETSEKKCFGNITVSMNTVMANLNLKICNQYSVDFLTTSSEAKHSVFAMGLQNQMIHITEGASYKDVPLQHILWLARTA